MRRNEPHSALPFNKVCSPSNHSLRVYVMELKNMKKKISRSADIAVNAREIQYVATQEKIK